jgi:hypothetical protein
MNSNRNWTDMEEEEEEESSRHTIEESSGQERGKNSILK